MYWLIGYGILSWGAALALVSRLQCYCGVGTDDGDAGNSQAWVIGKVILVLSAPVWLPIALTMIGYRLLQCFGAQR